MNRSEPLPTPTTGLRDNRNPADREREALMPNLPHPSTSEFANRHSKVFLAQRVFTVMCSPQAKPALSSVPWTTSYPSFAGTP